MAHNKGATGIISRKIENEYADITYPELKLKHKKAQNKINNLILDRTQSFIKKELDKFSHQRNINGKYKVTLNKRNLLSIIFEFYSYLPEENSTFDLLKSLTIDTRECCIYNFNDLFYEGSNYENSINTIIIENIKENSIPIIEEYANINKNRKFYLTEDSLVIYYELDRNSKYASIYCIPQFTIPYNSIKNFINPYGPIARFF
ncbi:MAG: DUF3298 domain-containing protein [Clostridiaceae bacterium]